MIKKQYGLLGHNISYSLSPLIHNFSAQILGLDLEYILYDIQPGDLTKFAEKFFENRGHGLNVTTPYKEKMAEFAGSKLSAVNTLALSNHNEIEGFSTDGEGLLNGLTRDGIMMLDADHIIILGSGGVVTSLLEFLSEKNFSGIISIFSRSENSKYYFNSSTFLISQYRINLQEFSIQIDKMTSNKSLIIQATSAPTHGDTLEYLVPALDRYYGQFVDLVYAKPSALYFHCRNKKLKCQKGLPMLIEQARLTQKIWWGDSAPYEKISDYLEQIK